MTPGLKKWTLRFLKLAVCAGALWYLAGLVSLDDHIRLASDPASKHVLLEEGPDSLRILDAQTGQERTISRDELATEAQTKPNRPLERGLRSIMRTLDWSWAVWAIIALGPTTPVLAWRLRELLKTQKIVLSFRDSIWLTFAGNFFNFAVPGTTGGDIYKAYHIAKRTKKRAEGVTIVVLDRVIGLISFLLLATVSLIGLTILGKPLIGQFGRWVGYFMVAFTVGSCLFFSARMRRLIGYDRLLAKLPFADKIRRIDETAFSFRYHPKQSMAALVITLINHFSIITAAYLLAKSLGVGAFAGHSEGDLYLACLLSVVVGYLFAAIPISYQGIGLIEAVYYRVMVEGGWCNINQMLALTMGIRVIQMLWSLPGVIAPWMGFQRPPSEEGDEAGECPAAAQGEGRIAAD